MKKKKLTISCKLAIFIVLIYVFCAIFAPYITPYTPNITSGERLLPPSPSHLFGTDNLSYDLFTQIIYGARSSLIIGICTAFFTVCMGTIIGTISGYLGGIVDKIIMRIVDIMVSVPRLPLMILLASFLGSSIRNVIAVLVILSWTHVARVVRSQVMLLKEYSYIRLAKAYGAGFFYILKTHIFPELRPILLIHMIRNISHAIVAESSLAFLGLGDLLSPSWGKTMKAAMEFNGIYFTPYWKWWIVSPLMTICVLVLAFSVISRNLEKSGR